MLWYIEQRWSRLGFWTRWRRLGIWGRARCSGECHIIEAHLLCWCKIVNIILFNLRWQKSLQFCKGGRRPPLFFFCCSGKKVGVIIKKKKSSSVKTRALAFLPERRPDRPDRHGPGYVVPWNLIFLLFLVSLTGRTNMVILGSSWGHSGIILESFLNMFGIIFQYV